jgi:ABC-type uncharacterized transport system permease subunit
MTTLTSPAPKRRVSRLLMQNGPIHQITASLLAALIALFIGALIILATGRSPIKAYSALLQGAFGSIRAIAQTLTKSTPILFTALSFAYPARAGQFNMGAEGQLLVGAMAAALIGVYATPLPAVIHVPLALLAAAAAGGIWGWIAGIMKVKTGASEIITTMMLNFIAFLFTAYLATYPFVADSRYPISQTEIIAESARLPHLLANSELSAALLIGLLCALALYFIIEKTTIGFELKSVGWSPLAVEDAGVDVNWHAVMAMTIGGALAGLGGAGEVLGNHERFILGFSPGYGYTGIAAGKLGLMHPLGAIVASVVLGGLVQGGTTMQRVAHVPPDLYMVLQAIIIIMALLPQLPRWVAPLFSQWNQSDADTIPKSQMEGELSEIGTAEEQVAKTGLDP